VPAQKIRINSGARPEVHPEGKSRDASELQEADAGFYHEAVFHVGEACEGHLMGLEEGGGRKEGKSGIGSGERGKRGGGRGRERGGEKVTRGRKRDSCLQEGGRGEGMGRGRERIRRREREDRRG
jgi:hypothetical protein